MSERPPLKTYQVIIHTVMIIIGWLLYIFAWIYVFKYYPEHLNIGGILILISFCLGLSVTAFWVYHNIGIHKRKGSRKSINVTTYQYAQDWNEHKIHAIWDEVKKASQIHIHIDPEKKEKHFLIRKLYG
ncbi:hypothetical protein Bealeia1_00155 [Candidatus Bealeia paramacronuclearis]|uniref:Poly-beta-1,6-N-acetyl-D-glucosamine biosynthesis protein PgaD n=1 Tax=Candidatus Bealeia paramacronuclearis TaxID=1921001 RepID=A0ABZ2C2V4_9PROT|nr:hypothetical protein [Candidatus Bealeia paramacronuclearis]